MATRAVLDTGDVRNRNWSGGPEAAALQKAVGTQEAHNAIGAKDRWWQTGTPAFQTLVDKDGAIREENVDVEDFREQNLIVQDGIYVLRGTDPPPKFKGALWAQAPDQPDRGDALFISRYPTELNVQVEANVGAQVVPGRAFRTLQNLGGKGVKFDLTLWFYDAFLDFKRYSPAVGAQHWVDAYVVGNDGLGGSLPYVFTYLQLGSSPPVRVMIHAADLKLAHFDRKDRPQEVLVRLSIELYEPIYLVSPFRPKAAPQTRKSKQIKVGECGRKPAVASLPSPSSGQALNSPASRQPVVEIVSEDQLNAQYEASVVVARVVNGAASALGVSRTLVAPDVGGRGLAPWKGD